MPEQLPKTHESHYIFAIQYLRGIAAIAVAIFHLTLAQEQFFPKKEAVMPIFYGLWGVDIFFVISGFIMVHITHDQHHGLRAIGRFWKNRIARIVPAYWLFTLLMFILVPVIHEHVKKINLYEIEDLFKSLLFIKIDAFPVLLVGWTLNYEMFFYVVFGLVMMFSHQYRAQITTGIFIFLAAVGVIIETQNPTLVFITNPIVVEFGIGMMIGWFHYNKVSCATMRGSWSILIGILLIASGIVMLDEEYMLEKRLFYWGLPAGLLLYGTLCLNLRKKIRVLRELGDISYSVYLCHVPIIISVVMILKMTPLRGVNPNMILVTASLLLILVVSMISYRLVEKPASEYIRNI